MTQLLSHIGLIGSGIENLQNSYLAGEKFLQLITFMGCSPHIRFEPEDDRDKGYCYISLSSSNNPRLRASEHARPPRCHACRKPLGGEWQTAVTHEAAITCLHCGQQQYADQLGWRNDAGLGRFFIEIHNIFPGEAQPVPQLQQQLQGIAGSPWRYFYLHKA
ncbi:MAG: hypothetical protein ABFR19_01205 [Pseudomonadota bacterium]